MNKEELLRELEELKTEYGEWTYDIPLPHDVWTRGNLNLPHKRLKRIVQATADLLNKPLSDCRVLDLGCLDGIFSIEFAHHGAETVGIEVREANVKKAIFCKKALGLDNLEFLHGDARNISIDKHGTFDAIICSGLLYHLTASDAIDLVRKIHEMSNKMVIIDTHVAKYPDFLHQRDDLEYWGTIYREHEPNEKQERKAKKLWASWDNEESFWFTKPSLINVLLDAGFSSVYECFAPSFISSDNSKIKASERGTFVAVKGIKKKLITSPAANEGVHKWPETSNTQTKKSKPFLEKLRAKFKG